MVNGQAEKRIAVITGATRGLGRAMCERLARYGFKVIALVRDKRRGRAMEAEFRAKGYDVSLKFADMEKVWDVERACRHIVRENPCVDVLINNAGVVLDTDQSRILSADMNVLRRTIDINLRGPLLMCKGLLPALLKSRSGRVINISSSAGRLSVDRQVHYPAYSISKTALNGLTKVLAHEVRETNVRVFSVDPGWVRTELGGAEATYSVEEGIDTAVYLATEDEAELKSGGFYFLRKLIEW